MADMASAPTAQVPDAVAHEATIAATRATRDDATQPVAGRTLGEYVVEAMADAEGAVEGALSPFASDLPPSAPDVEQVTSAMAGTAAEGGDSGAPAAAQVAAATLRAEHVPFTAPLPLASAASAALSSVASAATRAEHVVIDSVAAAAHAVHDRAFAPAAAAAMRAEHGAADALAKVVQLVVGHESGANTDDAGETHTRTVPVAVGPIAPPQLPEEKSAHGGQPSEHHLRDNLPAAAASVPMLGAVLDAVELAAHKFDAFADDIVDSVEQFARRSAEGTAAELGTRSSEADGSCVVVMREPAGGEKDVNTASRDEEVSVMPSAAEE